MARAKIESAELRGIFLKKGQRIKVNGKEYTIEHRTLMNDFSFSLTLKYDAPYVKGQPYPVQEEITVNEEELSEALGLDIWGFIE